MVEAIDAFAAILAFPATTIVCIFEGGKELAQFYIFILFVFYFWSALLAVDIETGRCTESITSLSVVVEAIDALATILAFPAVAIVSIFEGGEELAQIYFIIIILVFFFDSVVYFWSALLSVDVEAS